MKTKPLFFVIAFFGLTNLFSQNSSIGGIEEIVSSLKSKLETWEKVEMVNTIETKKYFYYKENDLQLASVQQIEKKIEKNVQWYFLNKQLLYSETNWLDTASGKLLYTEKTYHANGNLIAWLNNESTFVDSNSPEFKNLDKSLNDYSLKLRNEAMK